MLTNDFWAVLYAFKWYFEDGIKVWKNSEKIRNKSEKKSHFSIFFDIFVTKNAKNSYFWWFWELGSVLKRFFIAKRFLFHGSKSILVPKIIYEYIFLCPFCPRFASVLCSASVLCPFCPRSASVLCSAIDHSDIRFEFSVFFYVGYNWSKLILTFSFEQTL